MNLFIETVYNQIKMQMKRVINNDTDQICAPHTQQTHKREINNVYVW